MARQKVNMDLFSLLSIDLIQIILSFLINQKKDYAGRFADTKEATRTVILSKKFLKAWYTFPDLYFSKEVFRSYPLRLSANVEHVLQALTARDRLPNYVLHRVQTYKEHNVPIRTLHINAINREDAADSIIQILFQANENGVQEIYLGIQDIDPDLAQTIFALKRLVSLILFDGELVYKGVKDCDAFINCVSLRVLELRRVRINKELVQKLIRSCPLIEELKMVSCKGPKNIQIASLPFLKRLKVYTINNQRVDVKVESLEFMKIRYSSFLNIESAQNLKVLKLKYVKVGDKRLHNILANSPVLEELTLEICNYIQKIKVSSRSLTFLSIIFCWHLTEVEIDAPILNMFEYNGERVLSTLSFASGGTEKRKSSVTLYWIDNNPEEVPSFLELSVFLMTLKRSDTIHLKIWSKEITFDRSIIDGLRDENNIPEFDEVYISVRSPSSVYSALMEGLLWSFSPRILSVKRDFAEEEVFIRYLFEELLVQQDDDHPNNSTSASNCWRNYFKRAKFNDSEDGWLPLHSWKKSWANVVENLGNHYVLKLSRD